MSLSSAPTKHWLNLEHSIPSWRHTGMRYALPFFLVSIATSIILAVKLTGNPDGPFLFLFLVAVILSAWFAGTAPGWIAVALSSLAINYFFIVPIFEIDFAYKAILWSIAFVACAIISNTLSLHRRRVELRLRKAREESDAQVRDHLAELQSAYEKLRLETAETLHARAAQRDAERELARVSRITTMGALTASIAHEVNQPLTAVVANSNAALNWLRQNPPDLDEAKRSVTATIDAAGRAGAVIGEVLRMSKRGDTVQQSMDIEDVVMNVLSLIERELKVRDIILDVKFDPALPKLSGNSVELQQVMLNVIMNSIDAMEEVIDRQKELVIRGKVIDDHSIAVSVADTGKGFAECDPARIFDSFYSTKQNGMGMGLSISRSIIESHGGRITTAQGVPHGATFMMIFPIAGDEP